MHTKKIVIVKMRLWENRRIYKCVTTRFEIGKIDQNKNHINIYLLFIEQFGIFGSHSIIIFDAVACKESKKTPKWPKMYDRIWEMQRLSHNVHARHLPITKSNGRVDDDARDRTTKNERIKS